MRCYLSGPISAATDEAVAANKARMRAAEAALQSLGHSVVCPLDNGLHESAKWEEHMRADVRMMLAPDVEAVVLMDGWSNSDGAKEEERIARRFGMRTLAYAVVISMP